MNNDNLLERYQARVVMAGRRILADLPISNQVLCDFHKVQDYSLLRDEKSPTGFSKICSCCVVFLFPEAHPAAVSADPSKICDYEECLNVVPELLRGSVCANCSGEFCISHMADDDMCCIKCVREADEEYGIDHID